MSDDSPLHEEADVNRNISCGDVPVDNDKPLNRSSCSGIGPVMFSKLLMFPLSASNEPQKEYLKVLQGELNHYHEMVRQLEAVKSTMNEELEGYESELVRLDNYEMVEDFDRALKHARRAIADLERVIDVTNDISDEEEEVASIAEVEKTNKVSKHAPKDDDSDVANSHIIPAGVDVVAKQKKQDKKKSSAHAKVDEELEILDEEVKDIEFKLKDYNERIKRLEEIKSKLKPIDVERYLQADNKQMQLRVAVKATMEIIENKKQELEVIGKKMKLLGILSP